jgi:hypothetical protein
MVSRTLDQGFWDKAGIAEVEETRQVASHRGTDMGGRLELAGQCESEGV